RNITRHKGRSLFVILGISLSTAILLMSLFFQDSLDYLVKFQYHYSNRQDAKILLNREKGREVLHDARRLPGVKRAEPLFEMPYEIRNGLFKKTILVVGVPRGSEMLHVLDTSLRRVELPAHGIVLPEVTARSLGATTGDRLILKPLYPGFREKTAIVSRVIPQYLGQTAYMDHRSACQLMDESFAVNSILLRTDKAFEDELVEAVKDTPAVATVEIKDRVLGHFKKMFVDYMWIANLFYLFFAGVIGFSVIYTSAALSIGERARELATLRVLGLRHGEISSIVFGEYLALSVLGILTGFPLGLLFSLGIITAYQSELYTFPFVVYPVTYLWVTAAIALFLLLARLACERPLRKLDMVATLKRTD
ncbi:MAG: ABC transporter permease, partial [Planctomycetota bacterium]